MCPPHTAFSPLLAPPQHSPPVAALADALPRGVLPAAVEAGAGALGDAVPPGQVQPRGALAAAGAVVPAVPLLGSARGRAAGGAGGHAVRVPLPAAALPLCGAPGRSSATSQHIPTHPNTPQHIPTHPDTSQHVPTHPSTSRHVPTRPDTSQYIPTHPSHHVPHLSHHIPLHPSHHIPQCPSHHVPNPALCIPPRLFNGIPLHPSHHVPPCPTTSIPPSPPPTQPSHPAVGSAPRQQHRSPQHPRPQREGGRGQGMGFTRPNAVPFAGVLPWARGPWGTGASARHQGAHTPH